MADFIADPSLRSLLAQIVYQPDPASSVRRWQEAGADLAGCSLVIAMPPGIGNPLPGNLGRADFDGKAKSFLHGYYSHSHFVFIDDMIAEAMSAGTAGVIIDHSIMLDSNVIGAMRTFMEGKDLGDAEQSFLSMISYVKKNGLNTDALPYLFENYVPSCCSKERRNHVEDSFARFLQWSAAEPRSPVIAGLSDISSPISEQQAMATSKARVANIYDSPEGKEMLRGQLERYYGIYFCILSAAKLAASDLTLNAKMSALLESLHTNIKRIMVREVVLARLFFASPHKVPVLSEVSKSISKKKNVVEILKNVSWDLYFHRLMEAWSSDRSGGKFFIPFFATYDRRLSETKDIFSVDAVFVNRPHSQIVPFVSREKQEEINGFISSCEGKAYLSDDAIRSRLSEKQPPLEQIMEQCSDLEAEVVKIYHGSR